LLLLLEVLGEREGERDRERDSAQTFVIDTTPTCTFCAFHDFSPKKDDEMPGGV
jgi:hypothetical protein